MLNNSEVIVLLALLMFPVFIQIILPLIMLVGFGLLRLMGVGKFLSTQGEPNKQKKLQFG